MATMVDVRDLKVGMFVHLDLGWWAHPFALSSFLIVSPDQIDTIRSLKLQRVRWSPDKSQLAEAGDSLGAIQADGRSVSPESGLPDSGSPSVAPAASAPPGRAKTAQATQPAQPAHPAQTAQTAPTAAMPPGAASGTVLGAGQPRGPGGPMSAPPSAPQSAQLAEQLAATALCQQQVAEARNAWSEASQCVAQQPQRAREVVHGLTQALLDKLLGDQDMCVRALDDAGCDPAAGHALNVAVISLLMGRVFGFSPAEMQDMGVGALLHDIGKLELPERARHDDDRCGPGEHALYREHVAHGVQAGRRMGLEPGALLVIAQHHEMADASGFPQRLNLDRMSGAARIVALVNRYDNLCNPRNPAQALTPHEALQTLFAQSKNKFDITMLNAFIRMMGVYPPGSMVQLTDDRYASVISVNSSRPLKPRVLICDTSLPMEQALLLNLDGERNLGIRRSLKPQQLPSAVRQWLQPRQRMVYFFEPLQAQRAQPSEELAA